MTLSGWYMPLLEWSLAIVRLFADDCLLYRPIHSIQDQIQLQSDLAELQKWAELWGMKFNARKCYILRVSRRSTPLHYFYELDNHILQEVTTSPYLGLTFSSDMRWSTHITSAAAKANSTLGFIRRNLKYAPTLLKETAYKSLVSSRLE